MEWVERRHKRCVRVYPDEVSHTRLRDELGDLVGSIAVGINKKPTVAVADVVDKQVDEQRGLSHAAHALDVDVLRGVNHEVLLVDVINADGGHTVEVCRPLPRPRPHLTDGLHQERTGRPESAGLSSPADFAAIALSVAIWRYMSRNE